MATSSGCVGTKRVHVTSAPIFPLFSSIVSFRRLTLSVQLVCIKPSPSSDGLTTLVKARSLAQLPESLALGTSQSLDNVFHSLLHFLLTITLLMICVGIQEGLCGCVHVRWLFKDNVFHSLLHFLLTICLEGTLCRSWVQH